MTDQSKPDYRVLVRRGPDGAAYSEVVDMARPVGMYGEPLGVVIDRKSRMLDTNVIKRRAQSLAELLGIPCDIDLEWKCVARRKMICRCPECMKEGRV